MLVPQRNAVIDTAVTVAHDHVAKMLEVIRDTFTVWLACIFGCNFVIPW